MAEGPNRLLSRHGAPDCDAGSPGGEWDRGKGEPRGTGHAVAEEDLDYDPEDDDEDAESDERSERSCPGVRAAPRHHDPGDDREDEEEKKWVSCAAGGDGESPGPAPPGDWVQRLEAGAQHLGDAIICTPCAKQRPGADEKDQACPDDERGKAWGFVA